jgi:hypothetical protein
VATSEVSHGGAIGGVGSALLVLVPARRPWYKKREGRGRGGGEGPGCFRIHAHTRARAWLCIENAGNAGTPPPAESVTLRTSEHGLAPGCGRPHERDSVRGGGGGGRGPGYSCSSENAGRGLVYTYRELGERRYRLPLPRRLH